MPFIAIAEAVTGVALLLVPALVARLLLGAEIDGAAIQLARVAGIALVGLGISCWPGPPVMGMLTYSALVTLYLGWLGIVGAATGILLWPAFALHVIMTILLVAFMDRNRKASGA
ncbi:MAG TPA: hypothetical protein PK402_01445 [Tepidisphaeraceae bacterium]|nr:hypothetical protein [Tepidisphaeraceae bacterium]